MEIRGSLRNFSLASRIAYIIGGGLIPAGLLIATVCLAFVGEYAWPLPPIAMVLLFTLIVDNKGKRASVNSDEVVYRDSLKEIRISLAHVKCVLSTTRGNAQILAIRSRSGTIIRLEEAFSADDLRKYTAELDARLRAIGGIVKDVPYHEFWPLLAEFPRTKEERFRMLWYLAAVGGGGGMVSALGAGAFVIAQKGYPSLAMMLALVSSSLALMVFERWMRKPWTAALTFTLMGLALSLYGAYSLLASFGGFDLLVNRGYWPLYVFALFVGVAIAALGWSLVKMIERRKRKIELKIDSILSGP